MNDKPPKPGAIADAEALTGSDAAQMRVRRWWRLVPRVLTRPADVFVALRDDDEIDVDARSEPILAIVILAGMAGILLTPAWGTLLDEESLDWLVLAVVTFIGGLFYGAAGYFLLGLVVWLGARAVGVETPRADRRGSSSGSLRSRSRSRSSSRCRRSCFAFGNDWFRTGGSDDGSGRAVVLAVGLAFALWSLGAARRRPADDVRAALARRRRERSRSQR